jgi:glutamate synthase (ferredoxin)
MIAVDLQQNKIVKNWEIKQEIASQKPYGEWLHQYRVHINKLPLEPEKTLDSSELLRLQTAFGYTAEDVEMIISAMAKDGKEPTFCMGDDIPLAVLSDKPRLLYDYFKQRFAQVTNPPIDPLRESLVMSLNMHLGERGNLLHIEPENAQTILLESPVISNPEMDKIKNSGFDCIELSTLFPIHKGPKGLELALNQLCQQATEAVNSGQQIIILSDRVGGELSSEYTYIPPLLAVGTVHQHLVRQGLRLKASLIVDTAQCWSTHHYACLIGFGASAICPYLTLETVCHWWNDSKTQKMMEKGKIAYI